MFLKCSFRDYDYFRWHLSRALHFFFQDFNQKKKLNLRCGVASLPTQNIYLRNLFFIIMLAGWADSLTVSSGSSWRRNNLLLRWRCWIRRCCAAGFPLLLWTPPQCRRTCGLWSLGGGATWRRRRAEPRPWKSSRRRPRRFSVRDLGGIQKKRDKTTIFIAFHVTLKKPDGSLVI